MRLEIEQYFNHKWNYDENNALRIDEVKKILSNLPNGVTRMIITDFLFHEFVNVFHETLFRFRKWNSKLKYCYYNYEDQVYSNFILQFLQYLNPVLIKKNQRIFNELEEVDEIIFICKGHYVVGYKINE